jgi:hypothetical protein
MALSDTNTRFKFFFPDARVLSEEEIAALPAEKKQSVETDAKKGVWLEVFCPDASCVRADGRISIPAEGIESAEKKGVWLNLFCPEGSCELREGTDLP